MSLKVAAQVSDVIIKQSPEYIEYSHEKFNNFLKYYYEFLETDYLNNPDNPAEYIPYNGALTSLRNMLQNIDVDTTTEEFLEMIKLKVLPAMSKIQGGESYKAEESTLIKFIRDFYKIKGTEQSIQFIISQIFDYKSELEYGKNFVFRLSNNEYYGEDVVVLAMPNFGENSDMSKIMGTNIKQGNVSAFVENVEVRSLESKFFYVCRIKKHNRNSKFSANNITPVYVYKNDDPEKIVWATQLTYIIPDIDIIERGSLYNSNLPIEIVGGSGVSAAGVVDEVLAGNLTEINVVSRGVGYTIDDPININTDDSYGVGAHAIIEAIDGYGSDATPVMTCSSVDIISSGKSYNVGELIELENSNDNYGKPIVLKVASVTDATSSFAIINPGQKYKTPKIMIVDGGDIDIATAYTLNSTGGITNIVSADSDISGSAKVYANASNNAYGTILMPSNSSPVTCTMTEAGYNYNTPFEIVYYNHIDIVTTAWVTSTAYTVGTYRKNDTNKIYQCIVAGTSAGSGGPTGTTSGIIDGTCTWDFVALVWESATAYAVNDIVFSSSNLYRCISAGTSGTTGPNGTGTSILNGTNVWEWINPNISTSILNNCTRTTTTISSDATGGRLTSFVLSLKTGILAFPYKNKPIYCKAVANPLYGSGADILVRKGGAVATYTIEYAGEFSSPLNVYALTHKNRTDPIGSSYTSGGYGFVCDLNLTLSKIIISSVGTAYVPNHVTSSVTGGLGSGAEFFIHLAGNSIEKVEVIETGENYPITTTLSATEGNSANLIPTIVNGRIVAVSVISGGSGYTSTSSITTVTGQTAITVSSPTVINTGKILKVNIENSGQGYYSSSEVSPIIITGTNGSGAELYPIIDNAGSFKGIHIVNGGFGYTAAEFNISGGNPTSAASISYTVNNGKIIGYNIIAAGSGYKLGTYIDIEGNGTGASIEPIIETGITDISISIPGKGYTHPKVLIYEKIAGSPVNTSAVAILSKDNVGRITTGQIINSGEGFISPEAIIYNDPGSAKIAASIISGAVSLSLVASNGGKYPKGVVPSIEVIGDGTAASFTVTMNTSNAEYDTIQSFSANSGSNYTWAIAYAFYSAPNSLINAECIVKSKRNIKEVIINNAGSLYTHIKLNVIGAGTGALLSSTIDYKEGNSVGGISEIIISEPGIKYKNIPSIKIDNSFSNISISGCTSLYEGQNTPSTIYGTFTDVNVGDLVTNENVIPKHTIVVSMHASPTPHIIISNPIIGSGFSNETLVFSKTGKISKIALLNRGNGYMKLPRCSINSSTGVGAKLISYSDNIGRIKSVNISNNGINYEKIPRTIFPLVAQVDGTFSFKPNDILYDSKHSYLTNDYSDGPKAKVIKCDHANNILYLEATDIVTLITEDGDILVNNNNIEFAEEQSYKFDKTTLIENSRDKTTSKIINANRAYGIAKNDTFGKLKSNFVNNFSKLSNSNIKIHNGYNIQDFSYFVKTGIKKSAYEGILKSLCHPAGYAMFGIMNLEHKFNISVNLPSFFDQDFNKLTLIILLSPIAIPRSTFKLISLEEDKFKFCAISDDIIAHYMPEMRTYYGAANLIPETAGSNTISDFQYFTIENVMDENYVFTEIDEIRFRYENRNTIVTQWVTS